MSPQTTPVLVRPREEADLLGLVALLGLQQAQTGYPHRWPLPFPAVDFVRRAAEESAWVVRFDDVVVGQVAVLSAGDEELSHLAARAHGCRAEELAVVSAYFVDRRLRGRGLGTLLMDAVLAWASLHDRHLCLDVLTGDGTLPAMYVARGWRDVGSVRMPWQPDDMAPLRVMIHPGVHAAAHLTGSRDRTSSFLDHRGRRGRRPQVG